MVYVERTTDHGSCSPVCRMWVGDGQGSLLSSVFLMLFISFLRITLWERSNSCSTAVMPL